MHFHRIRTKNFHHLQSTFSVILLTLRSYKTLKLTLETMNLTRFLSYMKHALMVVAMLTIVGISGCDDDDDKPTKNIWELVQADSDLSILKDQMTTAGFESTLSATGSFTLFAPSNTAMTNLLQTLFGATDPALFNQVAPTIIQAVLNYHFIESQNLASSLTNNVELTTKQGEKIKVVVTT